MHNFTLADLLGSAEATLWLTLLVFVPGYVAGWLSNVFQFRSQRLVWRLVLSTPLGIVAVPIIVDLAGRYPPLLWSLFAASWVIFAWLAYRQLRLESIALSREARIGIVVVAGWAVLALLSLADLQLGDRLYFSSSAYDHAVRAMMTAAAARHIPPDNPFFGGPGAPPLRYHYFWMQVCSLVTRLSGIAPRQALYGGAVWAGIALMSLIPVALKFFTGARERLGRKALIGLGLLSVTGLDLLPSLYESHFKAPRYADPEWWNVQVTSWVDVLLWTPHHLLAMVACLAGFIVLRQPAASRTAKVVNVAFAALAFASAAGLSTLVTFTFAAFAGLWLLIALCRRRWDEVTLMLAAGVLAVLLALPYLLVVFSPGGNPTGSGHIVSFAVREFPLGMRMLARHTHLNISPNLFNLLMLPISYSLEFGFFLLVAVLRARQIRRSKAALSREEVAAWTMVAVSFFIGSFIRSTWTANDLGWRCFLQTQFVFLLWSAWLLDEWWATPGPQVSPRLRRLACALLIIGVLGSAYQVVSLRIYPILQDHHLVRGPDFLGPDRQLGHRTAALRSAYGELHTLVPRNAVVQFNAFEKAYIPHLLYSDHDAIAGMSDCGIAFGGSASRCAPRMTALIALYANPSLVDPVRLDAICREYGINVILAEDIDPVWRDPGSWVWKRTPLVANSYARAFRCGD